MNKGISMKNKVRLRLYITENAPHSNKAIVNLRDLLQQLDFKNYQLEILDIHKHSHQALADKVLVAPTLLKISSEAVIRLVGDLADAQSVKRKLEIK